MFFQIMKASLQKVMHLLMLTVSTSVSLEDLQIKPWSAESPKLYNLTLHVWMMAKLLKSFQLRLDLDTLKLKINSCF